MGPLKKLAKLLDLDISGAIGSGPTFADFSGDGFLDLFHRRSFFSNHKPRLFLNNGNGTFYRYFCRQSTNQLCQSPNTFSAAFGDYDLDNDLDLFISHWGGLNVVRMTSSEHLWKNNDG